MPTALSDAGPAGGSATSWVEPHDNHPLLPLQTCTSSTVWPARDNKRGHRVDSLQRNTTRILARSIAQSAFILPCLGNAPFHCVHQTLLRLHFRCTHHRNAARNPKVATLTTPTCPILQASPIRLGLGVHANSNDGPFRNVPQACLYKQRCKRCLLAKGADHPTRLAVPVILANPDILAASYNTLTTPASSQARQTPSNHTKRGIPAHAPTWRGVSPSPRTSPTPATIAPRKGRLNLHQQIALHHEECAAQMKTVQFENGQIATTNTECLEDVENPKTPHLTLTLTVF